jgi:uncharacterized membrane protein YdjX (TVP38/TMEM64 family)
VTNDADLDPDLADTNPTGYEDRWSRGAVLRIGVAAGILAALFVLNRGQGLPDVHELQSRVTAAGKTGGLVFVTGFALLALLPVPKGAMTALGGLLFGLWLGAALSFVGALAGAMLARETAAWLGRGTIARLTRGRRARAESLLADHGVGTVVAARLVPVLPYVVINYTCGLLEIRRRGYLMGSAVGLVPGSLTYAALGASGGQPSHPIVVLAAMLALAAIAGVWGRQRLLAVAPDPAAGGAPSVTTDEPQTPPS